MTQSYGWNLQRLQHSRNKYSVCLSRLFSLVDGVPPVPRRGAIVRCGLRGISWSISSRNVHTTCARTSALNRTDKRRRAARRIDLMCTSRASCGNNILRVFVGQLSEVVPFLLLQQWPAKRCYVGLVAVGVQEQSEDILVPSLLRNCLTLNYILLS